MRHWGEKRNDAPGGLIRAGWEPWPDGGGDAGRRGGGARSGGHGGSESPWHRIITFDGALRTVGSLSDSVTRPLFPHFQGAGWTQRCLGTPTCPWQCPIFTSSSSLMLGDPSCLHSRKSHIMFAFSGKLKPTLKAHRDFARTPAGPRSAGCLSSHEHTGGCPGFEDTTRRGKALHRITLPKNNSFAATIWDIRSPKMVPEL